MIEVAVVLIKQGEDFVLQHRDNIRTIADPGMIGLWGGLIEPQDLTPEDAAVRELFEETGVKTDAKNLKHLISYETIAKGPKSFGKPVTAHLYFIELSPDIVVNCFEGLEVLRVSDFTQIPESKRSEFLLKAIEAYESAR